MIGFILAGALGAIALIVYLLFRRLRALSWQLTQLRVERDCERILREIGISGGSRPVVTAPPAPPVRRKRHLSLYLGGLGATLASLKEASRRHRPALVASGAASAVVMSAAAMILATSLHPPRENSNVPARSPTSIPSQPGPAPPSRSSPGHTTGRTPGVPSASGGVAGTHHGAMGGISKLSPSVPPGPSSSAGPGGPPSPGQSPPATGTTSSAPTPSGPAAHTPCPVLCVHVRALPGAKVCLKI